MIWAEVIVYLVFAYLGLGALFALWFVASGITKLDDSARETGFLLRFIIFFGAVPFWLLLAWRLWQGKAENTKLKIEN